MTKTIDTEKLINTLVQCSKEAFDDCAIYHGVELDDLDYKQASEDYGESLRTAIETFVKGLESEIKAKTTKQEVLEIEFVTIDNWNRPIFRPVDKTKKYYLSDPGNLFDYQDCIDCIETIKEFYTDTAFPLNCYITYHGRSIDSEPMGTKMNYDLQIKWS